MILAMPLLVCTTPVPAPLSDPTLQRLLAEARALSLDLALATARLEAARVAARAAGADLRPQVDGTASMERKRDGRDGEVLPSTRTSHRAGLEASWEIDLWGRLRHVRTAATREMEAAEADLQGAQLLLEAEVVRAYQDLRYAQAAQAVQIRRVAAFRQLVAIHSARGAAGIATSAEQFRTEAELRQAETEVQATRRELVQARHRLALLLGRTDMTLLDLLPAVPCALPDLPPGLSSDVLGARPDILAASRRHAATLARVGETRAARLPRFTLTGAYGFASSELKELAGADSVGWSLIPRLSLPLFDGGRSRARVEAAEAEAQRAEVELRQTQRRALAEVAEHLELLESDSQTLAHWEGAALAAERVFVGRMAEHQAGRGTGLASAQAELQMLTLRLQVFQASRARDHTRVGLRLALGTGWIKH